MPVSPPALFGYHPCESHCNRGPIDSAVSIHAVERFLGDMAAQEGWPLPIERRVSGKRVLVVGAGPSGLSAAYHLARLGHAVEIHEAGPLPGGMLHFGIPAYRLPREELMKEMRPDRGDGRRDRAQSQGGRRAGRDGGGRVSMRSSWRSALTSASASTFRRATPRACADGGEPAA